MKFLYTNLRAYSTQALSDNHKYWLGGFVEGEGSLLVSIVVNPKIKQGIAGNTQAYSTSTAIPSGFSFPIKIYVNADTDKLRIMTDNKGKAGVYRWTNLKNGKTYIGSGINLYKRIGEYYSQRNLERQIIRYKSKISRSILKHGHSNFSLEILEYCTPLEPIEREQYYLDLFKPEYNILRTAGNSLGFKHSDETKAKEKALTSERLEHLNRLHSDPEFKAKRLEHLKVLNSSKQQLEHLKRLHSNLAIILKGCAKPEGSGRPSVSIEVLDSLTNETTVYSSMGEAARAIEVNQTTISKRFCCLN